MRQFKLPAKEKKKKKKKGKRFFFFGPTSAQRLGWVWK